MIPNELLEQYKMAERIRYFARKGYTVDPTKIDILEKIVAGEPVESELTEKFNAEIAFGEKELISLLYYLGYLTIRENEFGILKFGSPNDVIRKIYSEYFLEYIKRKAGINPAFLFIGYFTHSPSSICFLDSLCHNLRLE